MAQPNQWPNCDQIEGLCPLYEMSQKTGVSILDALMTFIWNAEPGSRLTLQANRNELTLQVTGAVQRSGGEALDLERLQNIGKGLGSSETTSEIGIDFNSTYPEIPEGTTNQPSDIRR